MKYNPEINLGTLIEIFMFAVVILGAAKKLGSLETKVNTMYEWFQSDVIHRQPPKSRTAHGD